MGRIPEDTPSLGVLSGNIMYCMPKVGTRASLFLQDGDGGHAVVLNSPRENGDSCAAMGDQVCAVSQQSMASSFFFTQKAWGS